MRVVVSLAGTLLIAGCVAVGTQVTQEEIGQFHKGESSFQDITGRLGRPNSSSMTADGNRIACYTFVQSTTRPESFIPIVGAFVGGADAHTDMTCFSFDKDGILAHYTSTTSQTGAGYGFESGNSVTDDRVSSEPMHAR